MEEKYTFEDLVDDFALNIPLLYFSARTLVFTPMIDQVPADHPMIQFSVKVVERYALCMTTLGCLERLQRILSIG